MYNKSNALKKFDVSLGNKSPCLPQSSGMLSKVMYIYNGVFFASSLGTSQVRGLSGVRPHCS